MEIQNRIYRCPNCDRLGTIAGQEFLLTKDEEHGEGVYHIKCWMAQVAKSNPLMVIVPPAVPAQPDETPVQNP